MAGAEKFCVAEIAFSVPVPSECVPLLRNTTLPLGIPAVASGGATVAVRVRLPGSCSDELLLLSVVALVAFCPKAAGKGNRTSSGRQRSQTYLIGFLCSP
jgi:hypothetical protein